MLGNVLASPLILLVDSDPAQAETASGVAFELGADVCSWLAYHGEPVIDAVAPLRLVSQAARALHQRLVRVSQSGRMPDVGHTVDDMAGAWDDAMAVLRPLYGI